MSPRLAHIRFDPTIGELMLHPQNETSGEWFARVDVVHTCARTYRSMQESFPLVRDDVAPGEPPPPTGVATPRIVAAMLQTHLRAAFSFEEIHIWSHVDPGYHSMRRVR